MKYSILGFNQEKVLQFQREEMHNGKAKLISIDVIDLIILREISDFMNRKKIIKYIVYDKTFCYVKYSVIIDDLPIINIKQQALVDRLEKLCSFGFLEKHVVKNQAGSFPAFRIGEAYEMIAYSDDSSHTYQNTSANVSKYKCNIINNNNSNKCIENNNKSTINKEEKEIDKSISKKGNKFALDMSFVDETFMPIVLEWLEYKKEKRQSYKQRGFNAMYESLLKMSSNNPSVAKAIVEQSMQNNYAGLFPLKNNARFDNLPTGMIIRETLEERNEKLKNEKGW